MNGLDAYIGLLMFIGGVIVGMFIMDLRRQEDVLRLNNIIEAVKKHRDYLQKELERLEDELV